MCVAKIEQIVRSSLILYFFLTHENIRTFTKLDICINNPFLLGILEGFGMDFFGKIEFFFLVRLDLSSNLLHYFAGCESLAWYYPNLLIHENNDIIKRCYWQKSIQIFCIQSEHTLQYFKQCLINGCLKPCFFCFSIVMILTSWFLTVYTKSRRRIWCW